MEALKSSAFAELEAHEASGNVADFFEFAADKYGDLTCVEAVDSSTSYSFKGLDSVANQIAHWALEYCKPLDTVALMMENCPEFLAWTMGLAKAGITVALLNTNNHGPLLGHALETAAPKLVIVSVAYLNVWSVLESTLDVPVFWVAGHDIPVDLPSFTSSNLKHFPLQPEIIKGQPNSRLNRKIRSQVTPRTPLYYIYTSGTTGPSKAAKFSHKRFIGAAVTWAGPSGLKTGNKYYIPLPLYHGNGGVVAVAPCYLLGNTIVLRKKFSVSNFFKDVSEFNCKAMVYIGELWRYLISLDHDPVSPLKVIIGNGLRPELWNLVQSRFGISTIVEHYGSTEMPGDAILNYFNRVGSCGYLPLDVSEAKSMTGQGGVLVCFDVQEDQVVRVDGRCVACGPDQVGEMIMRLPDGVYDGYVGLEQTRRKLYENVFEDGDVWWSSGDLLKMDHEGFFYFVDRTGDTFRWKGENVSTKGAFLFILEVEGILGALKVVSEVNVYGVVIPNADGKAGMACISLKPGCEMDWKSLETQLSLLPSYARPLYLRLRTKESDKTSTLKFQKFKYAQQGYNVSLVQEDAIYVKDKNYNWVLLT